MSYTHKLVNYVFSILNCNFSKLYCIKFYHCLFIEERFIIALTHKEENHMKEFRNKLIVHGLMKINDKYLVIKRSIIKRGKPNVYPEYWDIPGGSVEDFETPVEALIREAKEEVNLDVEVKQIIHEDSNFDKGKNTMFTRLVYICTLKNTNDYVIQLDPEEHSEYRLISSLDEMFDEKVVPFLIDILSNKNL